MECFLHLRKRNADNRVIQNSHKQAYRHHSRHPPPVSLCHFSDPSSTASRKFLGSLGTSGRSFVGPVKRAMGSAIVVGNKSQDALAQVREGGPTGASEQAANQDR